MRHLRIHARPWGLASAFLLALPIAPVHAQIEAGRVIDDSTSAPLVGSRIILQRDTAGTWKTVETTHTDAQGLFQLGPYPPGIYRVALLGRTDPTYFGAVDTLAADSMQQREFRLPITRRSAASAYLVSEVEHPVEALGSLPAFPFSSSDLRSVGPSGEVDTRFVVNADGGIDVSSIRVITATDPTFAESIRRILIGVHYRPATIGGIPVRQTVERKDRIQIRVEDRRVR